MDCSALRCHGVLSSMIIASMGEGISGHRYIVTRSIESVLLDTDNYVNIHIALQHVSLPWRSAADVILARCVLLLEWPGDMQGSAKLCDRTERRILGYLIIARRCQMEFGIYL